MGKKASNILKGEIVSSIFYIAFGLCLVLIPEQTVNLICKVIFGVVMISTGLYHIYIYTREKENATILDLFSGVIALVLGGFLFMTPQIVIKILPYLLSAFVLVDSIWTLKGSRKLKKLGNSAWKVLLGGSLIFIVLGLVMMFYPFSMVKYTVIFSGCVFLANGIGDIIFLIILHLGIKKGMIILPEEQQETDKMNTNQEKAEQKETEDLKTEMEKPKKKAFFRKRNKNTDDVSEQKELENKFTNEQQPGMASDMEWAAAETDSIVQKNTADTADTDDASCNREESIKDRWETEGENLVSPAREIKEMQEKSSLLWHDEEPLEEWKD